MRHIYCCVNLDVSKAAGGETPKSMSLGAIDDISSAGDTAGCRPDRGEGKVPAGAAELQGSGRRRLLREQGAPRRVTMFGRFS
jgi:hypothetical protein